MAGKVTGCFYCFCFLVHLSLTDIKGTVMQIEKAQANGRLCVSKVS